MVPLLLMISAKKRMYPTLLLLSFFMIEDGGVAHGIVQTPAVLRYFLCVLGIIYILLNGKFKSVTTQTRLLWSLLLFSLILPVIYGQSIDHSTLNQSLLLIVAFGLPTFFNAEVKLEMNTVIPFLFGYTLGEYLLFYSLGGRSFLGYDYLNYSSLKWIITIVPLYLLFKGRLFYSLVLLLFCLPVLVWYGTRLILVVFLFSYLFFFVRRLSIIKMFVALTCLFLFVYSLMSSIDLTQNKMLSMLHYLKESDFNVQALLLLADRVRFYEFQLFFSQDIVSIVFGNGIGSGLADPNGLLDFVARDGLEFAFTQDEINEKYYYGFHDTIIDVGVRFGILVVLYEFYSVFSKKRRVNIIYSYMLFSSLYVSLYTTTGIVFYFLLKNLRDAR